MKELAAKIVELIGGPENVNSFTHCATRLRFDIRDEGRIRQDELKDYVLPQLLNAELGQFRKG